MIQPRRIRLSDVRSRGLLDGGAPGLRDLIDKAPAPIRALFEPERGPRLPVGCPECGRCPRCGNRV